MMFSCMAVVVMLTAPISFSSQSETDPRLACQHSRNNPMLAAKSLSPMTLPNAFKSALNPQDTSSATTNDSINEREERRCVLLTFSILASDLPDDKFCSSAGDLVRALLLVTDDRVVSAMHAASAAVILHRAYTIPACSGQISSPAFRKDPRLVSLSQQLLAFRDDFVDLAPPARLLRPVANFFGDAWAKSLGLEGLAFSDALRFMHALLSRLPPSSNVLYQHHQVAVAALFAMMMERGRKLGDNALFLAELAKAYLTTYTNVLVPIGWISISGGHAMLMEVTYDATTETVTAAVYNSGSGSVSAHVLVKHKDRVNVVPFGIFMASLLGYYCTSWTSSSICSQ